MPAGHTPPPRNMRKLYSTLTMVAMMIAALSLSACECEDDEIDGDGSGGSSSFELKDLKGNWTTVSCSKNPNSIDESSLANVLFLIDYDGIYHFWSIKLGYGIIESIMDLEQYVKVISYSPTKIKVQVPKYSNAELIMKKYGKLDDSDYKYKLCNGAWLVGYDSTSDEASYLEVNSNADLSDEARKWRSDGYYCRLVRFKDDGTGECAYYTMTGRGYMDFYYTFSWELKDKTITIIKDGEEKHCKITLKAIDGEESLVFESSIW